MDSSTTSSTTSSPNLSEQTTSTSMSTSSSTPISSLHRLFSQSFGNVENNDGTVSSDIESDESCTCCVCKQVIARNKRQKKLKQAPLVSSSSVSISFHSTSVPPSITPSSQPFIAPSYSISSSVSFSIGRRVSTSRRDQVKGDITKSSRKPSADRLCKIVATVEVSQ